MSNMSYCRFRNTSSDLQDCINNWNDPDLLESDEEMGARTDIVQQCITILNNMGIGVSVEEWEVDEVISKYNKENIWAVEDEEELDDDDLEGIDEEE